MQYKIKFFAIFLALSSVAAVAEDMRWMFITTAPNGAVYMYDARTAKLDGRFRKAWVQAAGVSCDAKDSPGHCTLKMLWQFDCAEKKAGIAKTTLYDDRSNTNTSSDLKKANLEEQVPDTAGEAIVNEICSAGKIKSK